MPTYDYECGSCGYRFEQFQSMSEDPLRDCPSCGDASLKRLVGGGIGVIFKGSGFYVTDSKSGSGSRSGKTEKKEAEAAGGTETAKTEGSSSGGGENGSSAGSSDSGSASGGESKSKTTAGKTA
ncbi:MAG: FmdB family zinc ribbon protein [Spirochaetaceae bacterium]